MNKYFIFICIVIVTALLLTVRFVYVTGPEAVGCDSFCGEKNNGFELPALVHPKADLNDLNDIDKNSAGKCDGITRNMEVQNREGALSAISFLSKDGTRAFVKIFSALTVSDVTRLWNDLVVLEYSTDIRNIDVFMQSEGGDAFSGLGLADLLERAQRKGFHITAYASGIIASAAVPVFAVADVRVASPGTIFMVHEAALWKWPGRETASDIESQNNLMQMLRERYIDKLTSHSKIKKEQWLEMEKKTTWFSAEQALRWGLVDKIE